MELLYVLSTMISMFYMVFVIMGLIYLSLKINRAIRLLKEIKEGVMHAFPRAANVNVPSKAM